MDVPIRRRAGEVLAWRHPTPAGEPCEGSGEVYPETAVCEDRLGPSSTRSTTSTPAEPELGETEQASDGPGVISPRTRGVIAARWIVDQTIYQLEYIRCYKGKCRCMKSRSPLNWHGPYPFAYTTQRKKGGDTLTVGRWKRRYIKRDEWVELGIDTRRRR